MGAERRVRRNRGEGGREREHYFGLWFGLGCTPACERDLVSEEGGKHACW